MNLLEHAFQDLYGKDPNKPLFLKYSGRFREYGGNIRMTGNEITAQLSKTWRGVSPEIQQGLLQELLVKLFKTKKQTIRMDLYHNFIRSLPNVMPKTESDPLLETSFERVNGLMFNGLMEQPNLKFGKGINRLGTYEYATDTVALSKNLLENMQLLDYVMYHELLHKKHQYTAKAGRQAHHSRAFKEDERKFPNAEILEKELEKLVRRKKSRFFW